MLLILFIIILVAGIIGYVTYKISKKKSIAIALALLLFILPVGLFFHLIYSSTIGLTKQGEILNTLPDTSWVSDSLSAFYWDGNYSLCSTDIRGTNKKRFYDDVFSFQISPNGNKMALRTKGEDADIVIVDLVSSKSEVIEENGDYDPPFWTPDGSRIIYEFDDSKKFCIYNVLDKAKKIVNSPEMISDIVVNNSGDKIIYSGLFSKKCYQYDIVSGDTKELNKLGTAAGMPFIFNYINKKDIYWGTGGGSYSPSYPSKISPDKRIKAYNKEGSLWIKADSLDSMLVEYKGIYDSKSAPGVINMEWSADGKYLLFNFKGDIYVCDIAGRKTGYLTKGRSPRFYYKRQSPFSKWDLR